MKIEQRETVLQKEHMKRLLVMHYTFYPDLCTSFKCMYDTARTKISEQHPEETDEISFLIIPSK